MLIDCFVDLGFLFCCTKGMTILSATSSVRRNRSIVHNMKLEMPKIGQMSSFFIFLSSAKRDCCV